MWFGVPGEIKRGGGEGIEGEERGGEGIKGEEGEGEGTEGTSRDVGAIESHHLASSSSTHILAYVSACSQDTTTEHIANHMTVT